jgi:transcriptional regulator with XRE-family HTH domain
VKDLLVLLGKRVHELRAAKKWTQEEFAHLSGLHRTYIGQIERGEKNISFGNLVKISSVLGVSLPELLSAVDGSPVGRAAKPDSRDRQSGQTDRTVELQKLVGRLSFQRAALDRTIMSLEDLILGSTIAVGERSPRRRVHKKQ